MILKITEVIENTELILEVSFSVATSGPNFLQSQSQAFGNPLPIVAKDLVRGGLWM